MPKHGACNLSSINLSEYVLNPFTDDANIDYTSLHNDMYDIVKAMDDVLEENLENHALPEQREMARKYRNIGIGIMGFHDMLIKLGVTYGSSHSITIAYSLMQNLFNFALDASVLLAKTRGSFPGYSSEIWNAAIIKNNVSEEDLEEYKKLDMLRNSSLLSIAPTGSLGTMLNISTGVEPLFSDHYTRKTESLGGKVEYHSVEVPIIAEAKAHNWHPECLITAHDIDWNNRINIQGAFQRSCDTAISSTINLPETATVEDVSNLFIRAWKCGLKGVTIFRNNCARLGILTTGNETKKDNEEVNFNAIVPVSRKKMGVTSGSTFCKRCACGTLYITVNKDKDGNLVEVFTHTSKGGICQANLNAETRMLSLALRSGVKVDEIVDQLKGITCPACTAVKAKGGNLDGVSCADIIARTIVEFQGEKKKKEKKKDNSMECEECPECHERTLIRQGGCKECTSCGFSYCGM